MMNSSTNFNFNDPLFLHPSDAPGVSLVLDPLIGTENYGIWHRAMKLALHAKNKLGFIIGTIQRPSANSPTLLQWERCNAVVLSWLLSSVSKEIYCGLVYSTDAAAVWADLKERFDKVCGSRIYALHRDIVHLSQGSSTISVYFSKLKQLWDEYASLVVLPSCACPTSRAYVDHDQHQRLIQFLMGLNESYSAIRSQILMLNPLPSVNHAYSIICQEETHRTVLSSHPIADAPATVFHSSSKPTDALKCDHCNLPGHTRDSCFWLIGYPPGHKLHKKFPQTKGSKVSQKFPKVSAHNSVSTSSETSVSPLASGSTSSTVGMFTPTQYEQILRLLETSSSPTSATVNLAGNITSLMSISKATDWILDSGANAHITGTSTGLQNPHSCSSATGSVRLPNGTLDWEDHGDW